MKKGKENMEQIVNSMNNNFNECQYNAVVADGTRILVIAGPGTGKTHVLTSRIADLIINKNVAPSKILALTFTNKAALEMKERVGELLAGTEYAVPNMICTFHSFCFQLISDVEVVRRILSHRHIRKNLEIISKDEQKEFIERYCKEKGVKVTLLDILNLKNQAKSVEKYAEEEKCDIDILNAYNAYEVFLDNINKIDFEDLLIICKKGLEEDDFYENMALYKHILIDEYQDTNKIQEEIVNLILEHSQNASLFAVGDVDQAIYGFRGCSPEIMLGFKDKYKDAEILELKTNYRSQKTIVRAANEVVKNNENRYKKELSANKNNSMPLEIHQFPLIQRQAIFVADVIKEKVKNGANYSDFAILVRDNSQIESYEAVLASMEIPYVFPSVERILKKTHMQDILAYLKVVSGDATEKEYTRCLQLNENIGPTTIEAVLKHMKDTRDDIIKALDEAHTYVPKAKAKRLLEVAKIIKKVQECDASIEAIISMIIDETEYMKFIEKEMAREIKKANFDVNVSQKMKFKEKEVILHFEFFKNLAKIFDESKQKKTLKQFIKFLYSKEINDVVVVKDDAVNLLTMHKAKGLEWSYVFVDVNVKPIMEEDEEEIRVFYVAITRAKEELYLLHQRGQIIHPGVKYIPRNCFSENDDNELFNCSELGCNYKKGMIIEHELHKKGVIKNVEDWIVDGKKMQGQRLIVDFETESDVVLYTDFCFFNVIEEDN